MSWKRFIFWALPFLPLALVACQPQTELVEVTRVVAETPVEPRTVTEEVVIEVEPAPVGSTRRPIKVVFVPSVDADALVASGVALADALETATGLKFTVDVPPSYPEAIDSACASPDETMIFIPALAYVLANERCGVQVGNVAVRNGLSWDAAQIVVRVDSGIEFLEDLEGKTWAASSIASTSGFLYPVALLSSLGIEPGEIIDAGGHDRAMVAVYDGEADFATGYFSPPLLPDRQWRYGFDDPEIWRDANAPAVRNELGRVYVAGGPDEGGYRILDARTLIIETAPDVFEKTRILALTEQIPNDAVAFSAGFPLGLAQAIIEALADYASSAACQESTEMTLCSDGAYGWTGLLPVDDSFYDPIRFVIDTLGYTEEDILGE